ncbi:MAG: FAD-dependent oxidoreductase, partial [Actinomycetota bacterium]|nr:FAD-dependent oxidoreductase [Actinomycetota bacterium]
LAADRVNLTLLAPQPEFVYRPLLVDEPFSGEPAERHELDAIATELGAKLVRSGLASVDPDGHRAITTDGSEIAYDACVICTGAKSRPAYQSQLATTLQSWADPPAIDEALDRAAGHESKILAFVIPPGIGWALPLYELAILTNKRAVDRGMNLSVKIFSTEPQPLAVFGQRGSQAVAELLESRGIEFHGAKAVGESEAGLVVHPGGEPLIAGAVVALPLITGPRIAGLPSDSDGFVPVDRFGQVPGAKDVYAAGDCTNFPIKQGGLGTQQADAIAELIAERTGAPVDPQPFRPVLRGKLFTDMDSIFLSAPIAGGGGEGQTNPDSMWWPSHKVAGKYLAPYLAGDLSRFWTTPPEGAVSVDVDLPSEWHSQPMALDPIDPVR